MLYSLVAVVLVDVESVVYKERVRTPGRIDIIVVVFVLACYIYVSYLATYRFRADRAIYFRLAAWLHG